MNVQRGKLVSGGRLQVPAEIRRQLGLADGDPVLMRIVGGELHVVPLHHALSRVRERLRSFVADTGSLADELIADRRKASRNE